MIKQVIRLSVISCIAASSIFSTNANADTPDAAIGIKAGTLGAGIETTVPIMSGFNARFGINKYNVSHSFNSNGVNYSGSINLKSTSALVDWHPFGGGFRITGGLINNGNQANLTATPDVSGNYTFNGNTYSGSQVGTLAGQMSFNKVAQYVGIGWGNALNGKLTISTDIGIMNQGSPKLSLTSTGGSASNDPTFQSNLETYRQQAESDMAKYRYYPVASIGISFAF